MSIISVDAQAPTELPRLVVNILIDQLRTDYLETFAPLYGDDGFKRLMSEGRYYSDVQHPFAPVDRASATATLVTGATPRSHGVPALRWLSRKTLQPVFCVDDSRYAGIETSEKTSPNYLLTATVTDELKHATARQALVVSIAPERDMAVFLGGHSADGVVWLGDERGMWAGTSFYGSMPAWAANYNATESPAQRIAKTTWGPTYDNAYPSFLYYHALDDDKAKAFKHTFAGSHRYHEFKTSALVNDEVLNLASSCLETTKLGIDNTPDILSIGLYAGTFNNEAAETAPAELQDTYVRLDQTLGAFITKVLQRYGKERVVFVVSSTGYDASAYSPAISAGTFSIPKASMLLNMYLSAKFGQAQYVEATFGRQIFIDHKAVEQHQLQLNDILAESEAFLTQMEGVADVYSARSLAVGPRTPELTLVRNSWAPGRSGDIIVEVNSGWTVEQADGQKQTQRSQAYMAAPLFLLGSQYEAAHISSHVESTAIAPTIARCLRIRAPSASRAAPLQ